MYTCSRLFAYVSNQEEMLKVMTPVCEVRKNAKESVNEKNEGLLLKQFPGHLRYAFLGSHSEFPVIISSSLSQAENEKLIEVLRRHKGALAWSISDIKGISTNRIMFQAIN